MLYVYFIDDNCARFLVIFVCSSVIIQSQDQRAKKDGFELISRFWDCDWGKWLIKFISGFFFSFFCVVVLGWFGSFEFVLILVVFGSFGWWLMVVVVGCKHHLKKKKKNLTIGVFLKGYSNVLNLKIVNMI